MLTPRQMRYAATWSVGYHGGRKADERALRIYMQATPQERDRIAELESVIRAEKRELRQLRKRVRRLQLQARRLER